MANNVSTLSKATTDEILGDNLCFIIAFGKNGEILPYLRNDFQAIDEPPGGFNPMDYIDIKFNLPEEEQKQNQAISLFSSAEKCAAERIMRVARNCRRPDGTWGPCIGFPCP